MNKHSYAGYSPETFKFYFGNDPTIIFLKGEGTGVKPKYVYDKVTHSTTNEIEAQKIQVYIKDVGAKEIKLPKDFKLPKDIKDLASIQLINGAACNINRGKHHFLYLKADDIKLMN